MQNSKKCKGRVHIFVLLVILQVWLCLLTLKSSFSNELKLISYSSMKQSRFWTSLHSPEIVGHIPTVIIYHTALGTCIESPRMANKTKKNYNVPFVVELQYPRDIQIRIGGCTWYMCKCWTGVQTSTDHWYMMEKKKKEEISVALLILIESRFWNYDLNTIN